MCVCVCVRSVTFALRDFRIRRRVFLLFFIPSFACSLAPPLAFSPLFSILFWKRRKKGKKNRARNAERSFFSFFHPTLSISVSRLKSLIEVLQPASRPATRRKKKKCIDRNRLSVSFCTILFLLLQLLLSFTNYFFFSLLLSTEPPVRPNRFFSYPKPDPYYY